MVGVPEFQRSIHELALLLLMVFQYYTMIDCQLYCWARLRRW